MSQVTQSIAGRPSRFVNACGYDPQLAQRLGLLRARPADPVGSMLPAMDAAGIAKAMVVLENLSEEFRELHNRTGRLYALAHYNSADPVRGMDALRSLCERGRGVILGVATAFPCYGQDPRLKAFGPLYAYCLERHLPVVLRLTGGPDVAPTRPIACGVLASLYTGLQIICLAEPQEELAALLRAFPNLCLAVDMPPVATGDALERIVYSSGSRQVMFASGTYALQSANESNAAVQRLSFQHRNNVAWRTAGRVYGLPL